MECRKCGSNSIDVFRFELPESLPMAIAVAIPKNIRKELARLLENYESVEIHVCRNCGYTELKFVKRFSKPNNKDVDRSSSATNLL